MIRKAFVNNAIGRTEIYDRFKRSKKVKIKVNVMLTVFFYFRGAVHHEYAPEGHIITKEYYLEALRHLPDAVWREGPELWVSPTL